MKNYIKLTVALAILAVLVYALFVFDVPRAKAPEKVDNSFSTTTPFELVRVTYPAASSVVSSPLSISGEARGSWYFEASFPVKVIGADGAELGMGIAQAQSDWMTTEFVPFKATITWSAKGNKTGILRLMKDNPSGMESLEAHIDVPIKFIAAAAVIPNPPLGTCKVGGCSGEICSDQEGMASNCIYRAEFACYKSAACERQSNGQCGWTQTAALATCRANAQTSGGENIQ